MGCDRMLKRLDKPVLKAVFSLLVSFAVLLICSKNSFLYPLNDWVDVNCFFTVGRGITHGMVPYLDLYDQKGPILYFVYALAALISESSFLGVFFFWLSYKFWMLGASRYDGTGS